MPKTPTPLKGKKFVLTGKFKAWSRKDAEALLKKLGGTPASSVSVKTDLVFAGGAAGSKLYDAFRLRVPILGEGHIHLLLAGQPLDAVVTLARTFYTLEHVDARPAGSLSVLGGLPAGVGADRWPARGGEPMDHLFTLDLTTVPALQAHYPDQRTLSLFCARAAETTMYDIGQPNNGLTALRFSTQAQVDARPAPPPGKERPARWFEAVAHPWSELEDHFTRPRVLGGVPGWCQDEEHQGNFIMQCGEDFGVSGDGLVYVFDDVVFAQFT